MRPISASPMKGNMNSVPVMPTHDSSTGSDTTSFAVALAAVTGRGRGDTLGMVATEIPRIRGRSQSPVKSLRSDLTHHPLNRNLFSTPLQQSPSKGVINSDFTGRTFSERERAVELKAKGKEVPPLPTRTLAEVPWKKGASKSREGLELDEVDINVRLGNKTVSAKQTTTIPDSPTPVVEGKAPPAHIQPAMGPDPDSSTSSAGPASIPRYEMIIWRTFPARNGHSGREVPEQTRKCSFPITKNLARRLVDGQKADFISALNQFISTQRTGIPVTSDPSFTIQATVQPDGTSFPPEFLDLAEQQFADIIDEIISYQVQGYGRWSIDGMMRRVVISEAGRLASLGPCLEALVVITLEACGDGWVGLPGFDADGNLKPISRSGISEAKKAVHAGTPRWYLPSSTTMLTDGSATTLKSTKKENGRSPTSAILQHPLAATTSFPTVTAPIPSMASKGVAMTSLSPPKRISATIPVEQRSSSPDLAGGEEETGDEEMSMINTKSVQVAPKNGKMPPIVPMESRTIGITQVNARLGLSGIRLSTSTTPFLAPTPARHHGHDPSVLAAHTNNTPFNPASKLGYYPRTNSSTVVPFGDNTSSSDSDATPKPKPPTTEAKDTATATTDDGGHKAKAQGTLRRDVLVKGQFEAGKTYISTRNPSNPLPGTLLSPGLLEQESTLRMVIPTPPPKILAPLATTTTDVDTKNTKPQRSQAGVFRAGFARKPSGTLPSSKSGTFASRLQAPADGALATTKPQGKTLPPPTKSLQDLVQAAAGDTTVVRRRWEESTAASLRKERPASPVKLLANNPITRADSPVKRSSALGQPIATADNLARTVSFRALRTTGPRPKSRVEGATGQAGNRIRERVPSGTTVGVGRGNISSLRHEGKSN